MDGGAANGPVTQECNSSLMCKTFGSVPASRGRGFSPQASAWVWAQKVPLWPQRFNDHLGRQTVLAGFFLLLHLLCVCVKERERVACVCQPLGGEAGAQAGENVYIPSFFQLDFGGRLKGPQSSEIYGKKSQEAQKSPSRVTAAGVFLQKQVIHQGHCEAVGFAQHILRLPVGWRVPEARYQ